MASTQSQLHHADRHLIMDVDVRDKESFRSSLSAIAEGGLNLYAVFANAGIGGENAYGPEDRWNDILSVNLTGRCTLFKRIVNHSSVLLLSYLNGQNIFRHISCSAVQCGADASRSHRP